MDQPGGDLKAGDYFVITGWIGRKEYRQANVFSFFVGPTEDTDGNPIPNDNLCSNVMEVVSVMYPKVIVRVHSVHGIDAERAVLDLREFNYKHAEPDYAKAMVVPTSCLLCRFRKWRERRTHG